MSKVGQILTNPEIGWTRIDDTNASIKYSSGFERIQTAQSEIDRGDSDYNLTYTQATTAKGQTVSFSFTGTGFRVISRVSEARPKNIKVIVDGIERQSMSQAVVPVSVTPGFATQAVVYELTKLKKQSHTVLLECTEVSLYFNIDAIDIETDGFSPITTMVIKNPITNEQYSLAEKTLIPLPSASDKNIVLHGIEAGKEIQLDEAFNKIQYVSELSTATAGASGKVVTQKLLEPPNKITKISEVKV